MNDNTCMKCNGTGEDKTKSRITDGGHGFFPDCDRCRGTKIEPKSAIDFRVTAKGRHWAEQRQRLAHNVENLHVWRHLLTLLLCLMACGPEGHWKALPSLPDLAHPLGNGGLVPVYECQDGLGQPDGLLFGSCAEHCLPYTEITIACCDRDLGFVVHTGRPRLDAKTGWGYARSYEGLGCKDSQRSDLRPGHWKIWGVIPPTFRIEDAGAIRIPLVGSDCSPGHTLPADPGFYSRNKTIMDWYELVEFQPQ